MPFGLFVDIGAKFIGLIDIGHSSFNKGKNFHMIIQNGLKKEIL